MAAPSTMQKKKGKAATWGRKKEWLRFGKKKKTVVHGRVRG